MNEIRTVSQLITALQEHCGDPDTTEIMLGTTNGQELTIRAINGYPGSTVVLLAPKS